tara:strand:- start:458 stop:661 length:204 start_codon:yes stop_codon:yes gene_type:complete
MDFNTIRSWYELEEITEQQEKMIHIYQEEIATLELENRELKEKVLLLSKKLEYYFDEDESDDSGEED